MCYCYTSVQRPGPLFPLSLASHLFPFHIWKAVCNALGSNIFNILLGLGLPWWVTRHTQRTNCPLHSSTLLTAACTQHSSTLITDA
jgi:Ca2+/Na+ antiporter